MHPSSSTYGESWGHKSPKTLSGIETGAKSGLPTPPRCQQNPKTLSGIETGWRPARCHPNLLSPSEKPQNPIRD